MNSAPLFIIGTERSGSNLLRLVLNAHSGIAVPHPPHILKFFSPFELCYGDLSQPQILRRLVADVLGLVDVHIYPWELRLDPDVICSGSNPPDLLGIFFSIYNAYLRQSGKRRWGCKSTFMVHHISRILDACPGAKFIFLVRDPRDVAVSSRKSIFSPFHPYFTARLWRQQQLEGLRFYDSPGGDSCHLVRYEDLIAEPKRTVRQICEFIGEEYEPAMLEFHRTQSARKSEGLCESWRNTGSPILAGNQKNYVTGLSAGELQLVEMVTGELMDRFGYPRASQRGGRPNVLTAPSWPRLCSYWLMNLYWALQVEFRAMRRDQNYQQFWRRRLYLFKLRQRLLLKRIGAMFDKRADGVRRR